MLKNTITLYLLLSIKFYINFKHILTDSFNIFINKSNINIPLIFSYIKHLTFTRFNCRNKVNYTKRTRSLNSTKKTGKARTGASASCIRKKGLPWFGFRNLKLNNSVFGCKLLKYLVAYYKHNISIHNLEHIQFIYQTLNNFNSYLNLFKVPGNSGNFICNYNTNLLTLDNINLVY